MAVPAATIAAYVPWGNAQLVFQVGLDTEIEDPDTGNTILTETVDPSTGNVVPTKVELSYLAALSIQSPSWKAEPGADNTTYQCRGRLLSPPMLDPRITNGSQAIAVINGYRGRFELIVGLNMDMAAYRDIRQEIEGTFRVIGGAL
jgi:hypothetical protein